MFDTTPRFDRPPTFDGPLRFDTTPRARISVGVSLLAAATLIACVACRGPVDPGSAVPPPAATSSSSPADPTTDPTTEPDPTPDPEPNPTTDPTTAPEPTEEPEPTQEPEPSEEPGDDVIAGPVVHDFSDAVFGECGEPFALPERSSELVVETGPSGAVEPHGGWTTTIANTSDRLVQGWVAVTHVVVVDGDGRVVATPDPEDPVFFGAEGPSWIGVTAGDSVSASMQLPLGCATDDWLPAGEYEAFGVVTFSHPDGGYEQAHGGPWPLTIGGDGTPQQPTIPAGAVPVDLTCGARWQDPQPSTGFELTLLDRIRTPRPATDDIDGRAVVGVGADIDAILFTEVVLLRDGVVVGHMPGSDNVTTAMATAGTTIPDGFASDLLDCDSSMTSPQHLAPGEYQVVVVALTASAEGTLLLAATEKMPLAIV